jgi:hypothetical protein
MLTDEHHAVNRMIDRGDSFDHIEEYIDSLVLPEAQLGALCCWRGPRRPTPPPGDRWWPKRLAPAPSCNPARVLQGRQRLPPRARRRSWAHERSRDVRDRSAQHRRFSAQPCRDGRFLIVRIGGDEFLCVMPGATVRTQRLQLTAVCADLGN